MDNVNDLKQTTDRIVKNTPNKQPISLSTIGNDTTNAQTSININATNGLTGVQNNTEEDTRQVVRVNPNPGRRKVPHRSANSISDLNIVDPSTIIPPQPKAKPVTPRDKAINLLAEAVDRKQNEYKEFIQYAVNADAENRDRVEAGLEEVNGEMQYMPNELHVPMSKDEEVKPLGYDDNEDEEFFMDGNADYYDDKEEYEDDVDEDNYIDDSSFEEPSTPVRNTRIVNDFFNEEDESYNDDEEYISDEDDLYEDEEVLNNDTEYVAEESASSEEFDNYSYTNENTPVDIDAVYTDPDPTVEEETSEEKSTIFEPDSRVISSTLNENISTEDFEIDDNDFEDVSNSDEDDDNVSSEEIEILDEAAAQNLRADILKKIINTGKKVDTAQFTVSNKVVPLKNAMRNIKKVDRTATWPMMFTGRPFVASSLKGPEIAMLADMEENNNTGFAITREQARIIYEHDANPNRPGTMEAWCKTISILDLDSIFAALYCASMKGANYLPMVCPKNSCRNAYLSDDVPIESMLKFKNDDVKKKFDSIKNMELTSTNSLSYESVITVVNDNFAVGIKMPSLFNALYEYSSLNNEFIQKYASIIAVLQYIDYVYLIDPETSQFQPIGWKAYPGDYGKTYKSKISTYAKIFKEFSSTDFTLMTSLIDSIVIREAEARLYTFEVPSAKCPKCGTEIASEEMTARQMLFTQQRLVTLVTTHTER